MSATTKTCRICGAVKTLEEFARKRDTRDGRRARCRACVRAYDRSRTSATPEAREAKRTRNTAEAAVRRSRTPEQIEADRTRLHPDGMKTCPRCATAKEFADFTRDVAQVDGLRTKCRACKRIEDSLAAGKPLRREIDTAHGDHRDLWDRCALCGSDEIVGLDHVVPKPDGADDWRNLTPLCGTENRSKGSHSLFLYLEEQRPELLAAISGLPVVNVDGEPLAERFEDLDWSDLVEVDDPTGD